MYCRARWHLGRDGKLCSASPEVSLEAGIAYARAAAATGHPPRVVTRGAVSPDDPLDYLLDKVAETVWEAASSANSELDPYLRPMQNYLAALAGSTGTGPARDFALGVLTERVGRKKTAGPTSRATRAASAQRTGQAAATCATRAQAPG